MTKSLHSLHFKKVTKNNKKVKKSTIKRGGKPNRWCDNQLYIEFKQEEGNYNSAISENDPKKCESGMWDKFQAWKALKDGLQLPDDRKWQLITANANPISEKQEKHIIWGSIPLKYFFSSSSTYGLWKNIDEHYTNIRDIIDDNIRSQEILYDKKTSNNGITISENTIGKISGPVSFYFLKPSQTVPYDQTHYFPLIMLFGDLHRSKEKSCESCSCSEDSCCYTISDTPFLQLIDTLAETYPIDFYTETAFLGMGSGFKNGYMEDFTSGTFMSCYHHVLRNTSADKCPTKNIRWHASDARYMGVSNISNYDDYMKSFDKEVVSKKYLNDTYIEASLYSLPSLIYDLFKCFINYDLKTDYNDNIFWIYSVVIKYVKKTYFKRLEDYLIFIKETLNDTKTMNEFYEKFSVSIFKIMDKDNSLIEKQINKQTYPPFKLKKYWQDLLAMSLKNHHISDSYFTEYFNDFEINFEFIYNNLSKDIDSIFNFYKDFIKIFEKYSTDKITKSLVDTLNWPIEITSEFEKIPNPFYFNNLFHLNQEGIENWIGEYLNKENKDKAVSHLMNIKSSIKDDFTQLMNKYLTDNKLKIINEFQIYKKFFYILENITVMIMDLYTITRILKQPEGGKRSNLVICYFGNAHIEDIVYMLKKTRLYETSINLDKNDYNTNRCLDLHKLELNLNDELYDKY